ncbi:hypothetical protein SELSPUOL_02415 [Selenomonas sputigena ATCC 35185]|uniref:Uncharacterized protein n=1 Tax=Selenomonas sputigena (strain ATCC 35185 / DSM 20758 / CCUG 44933 / VPI D19B-28) TaxID=546271 RepID=C9LY56_SELS3|nr:hypothetical protein SELSPUOL_02415 [Selenomonas sputigena ATCC 35185]
MQIWATSFYQRFLKYFLKSACRVLVSDIQYKYEFKHFQYWSQKEDFH